MVLVKGSTAEELYASTLTVVGWAGFSKSQATWVAVSAPVREPAPQATRASEAATAAAPSNTRFGGRFRMELLLFTRAEGRRWSGRNTALPGMLYVCTQGKDRLSARLEHDRDLDQR